MSIENAILEHAAAVRELSASIKAMYAGRADALALPASQGGLVGAAVQAAESAGLGTVVRAAAEIGATKPQKDVELEQAAQKVEADAKIEEENSRHAERDEQAQKEEAAELAVLVYEKDVRPVLLAAIKKAGKDKVAEMLARYGVDKADKLKPEQLPAVLAEAQKLAA